MNPAWLYYKAYTGARPGAIEQLVADTIPAVLAEPLDVKRWFFVRYTDEGGGHLRLRMRVAPEAHEAIERVLHDGLKRLDNAAFPLYRPAVDPLLFGIPPVADGQPRIEKAVYEPETDEFGSEAMEIAESLFETSSRLAVQIVTAERAGRCSRKTLAPILMRDALRALAPGTPAEFWRKYAHHWLLYRPDWIAAWLPRFEKKHSALAAASVAVIAPDDALSDEARGMVASWRAALENAAAAYAAVSKRPSGRELAFRFMHLMNNRLGFYLAEEAYFATLLRCEEERS